MIDVVELFEELGVDYRAGGKNVAKNDVNICCPYCGEGRFHLAIHREDGRLNCWVCNFDYLKKRPRLIDLIAHMLDGDYRQSKSLIARFTSSDAEDTSAEIDPRKSAELKWPAGTFRFDQPGPFVEPRNMALAYLARRGFDNSHIDTFQLRFCVSGLYACRIMIPIYYMGNMVSFTGRDYTGNAALRYRNCPVDQSVMSPKNFFYNWDNYVLYLKEGGEKHVRIAEGPTDVWRIGQTCLGMMTNRMYPRQLSLLSTLGLKSASLIFDPGSYGKGIRFAEELSSFIPSIKVLRLTDKDPADMSQTDIFSLDYNTPPVVF